MISYAIDRTSRRRRSLALATAALFVVSSIFPIAAGLTHDTSMYPSWWGITDVSLAFVLAIMAMAVQTTGQDRITSEVDSATTGALQLSSASLNDPSTGDFDLELPSGAVESVEVLSNPFAAEYGRFSTSVTQVRTTP